MGSTVTFLQREYTENKEKIGMLEKDIAVARISDEKKKSTHAEINALKKEW